MLGLPKIRGSLFHVSGMARRSLVVLPDFESSEFLTQTDRQAVEECPYKALYYNAIGRYHLGSRKSEQNPLGGGATTAYPS